MKLLIRKGVNMKLENYFSVLERLKETVDRLNPIFMSGSQYEELRKTCSEEEILDFYEVLDNYVTNSGMILDTDSRYILTYSEYPFNPMLTELYRINLNFLDELEKPILMLIEDSSNLPKNVLETVVTESDIVELCQKIFLPDSNEVIVNCKETPISNLNTEPTIKNIEENSKNNYTNIADDFLYIVRKLEIIMAKDNKKHLFFEDLLEIFSELPYKLSEFRNISQNICKSLEKTNGLYYNGFITRKGYFLNLSNSEEFIGIPTCETKEKLVIYLFNKIELRKYNNILSNVSSKIKYLDEAEVITILRERGNLNE